MGPMQGPSFGTTPLGAMLGPLKGPIRGPTPGVALMGPLQGPVLGPYIRHWEPKWAPARPDPKALGSEEA